MSMITSPVPEPASLPAALASSTRSSAILALDLGTTTGWASLIGGIVQSGTVSFRPSRYDGGGRRYLRFQRWLETLAHETGGLGTVFFEEVRRHAGTDAAHLYGGFLATLSSWCERKQVAYQGVPVGTIKRFATGKGNAGKDAVLTAIRMRGYQPADDNEADAIALLLWAIETDGGVR
jgi:Holliday junction resolvasome RuvABC endonuclease subunit